MDLSNEEQQKLSEPRPPDVSRKLHWRTLWTIPKMNNFFVIDCICLKNSGGYTSSHN